MELVQSVPTTAPGCAFPGCARFAAMASSAARRGAPRKYCDVVDEHDRRLHTALTAFRERERLARAGAGRSRGADGDRPVEASIGRAARIQSDLRADIEQLAERLAGVLAELDRAGDIEAAEAQIEAAQAEAARQVAEMRAELAAEVERRREAQADAEEARRAAREADEQLRQAEEAMCTAQEQAREAREQLARGLMESDRQAREAAREVAEHGERAAAAVRGEAEARTQLKAERKAATDRLAAAQESMGDLRARAERAETLAQEERAERRRLLGGERPGAPRRRAHRGDRAAKAAARLLASSS